jgi:hypothetical protein
MFKRLRNLRLDFRFIGLLFMGWGTTILLEGVLAYYGQITGDKHEAVLLFVRGIFPLIIGLFLYYKGDDVLIRQDKQK